MKLLNYLNEVQYEPKILVEALKKECSEFLKFRLPFYRGVHKTILNFNTFTPKENRKPRDTDMETHNFLDQVFEKKFGWKARSEAIFASPYDPEQVKCYGIPYYFFPVNGFKYIRSQSIKDLFKYLENNKMLLSKVEFDINMLRIGFKTKEYYSKVKERKLKIKEEIVRIINTKYTDEGLEYITSNNEVMFKCSKYYLVNIRNFITSDPLFSVYQK